ncbi:BlaI/MecI/CopY family transcriptional regulator [Allofournierella sp.]|uniref:BlaI/MecI/CopY family transcriptional regulator n=1 Tax=Allofournierella sp. TaxID=1940256 RepID=UPI003AB3513A
MPEVKLFDSERKIMECLWEKGAMTAKELAGELEKTVGWSKPTTYTVLRKCVAKGAVERMEPGFRCRALVSRAEVCRQETDELIRRNYGGSADRLVASLLGGKKLSAQEIEGMKKLIEELE